MMKEFKMECKDIKHLLADYAIRELLPAEEKAVDAHLHSCEACQEELRFIRRIQNEADEIGKNCENLMTSIDWEQTAESITAGIPFKEPAYLRRRRAWFTWKLVAPAMTAIFMMGIWLGYVLFHQTPGPVPPPGPNGFSAQNDYSPSATNFRQASLHRMENTLARKEVAGYFQQSQIVLTDLMNTCGEDGSYPWKSQLDKNRIRSLLKKNRYFSENLDDSHLLTSKPLLGKIQWLLYELLMTDEKASCQKLQELQDFIKQERLLFKIRLVGKELNATDI